MAASCKHRVGSSVFIKVGNLTKSDGPSQKRFFANERVIPLSG
jgi:hypothetical protein